MPQTDQMAREALKQRVERVLGGWGSHTRFARGLGIDRSTLERAYTGVTADIAYIEAAIELLERVPRDQWPDRWKGASDGGEA